MRPAGRERLTKNDADYWLESEQMLKAAATRLRELKPLIELLTTPNPVSESLSGQSMSAPPVTELELSSIVEGIAEAAGSYGGLAELASLDCSIRSIQANQL